MKLDKAKFEYEYSHGWMINLLGLVITCALGYSATPNSEMFLKIAMGIAGIFFAIGFFGYSYNENKKFKSVLRTYEKIIKSNSQ